MKNCEVSNCPKKVKGNRKYCGAHTARFYRTGNVRQNEPIGYRNHGHKKNGSSTYNSWLMMRNRCNNPNAMDRSYYKDKGITVCKRWNKFQNFLLDMGEKPTLKHTIGRINSLKGYTKYNCRWETREQQARNRSYCKLNLRKAKLIRKYFKQGFTQKQLAEIFKVGKTTISSVTSGKTWV